MRIVACLLTIVLLAGCTDKDKPPSGILPREKMGNVLWDMIQADQYSAIYLVKDTARINLKTEDLRLYQQVFQLHGISRDEFRKSFQYYEDRPDQLRTLLDSMLSRGNRLRAESYSRPVLNTRPAVTTSAPPANTPAKTPTHPVTAPGQSHTAPGQSRTAPGQSRTAPGQYRKPPQKKLKDSSSRS
jgi:hypothetical protein